MWLRVDPALSTRFPELKALATIIWEVSVKPEDQELENFKCSVLQELRKTHSLDSIKEEPVFRAYRDFYWRIGIDPTKLRPAGEALVRRALGGKPIPKINTLVDTYNLISLKTGVAIGAFDLDKIDGEPHLREAKKGERFLGIGMKDPEILSGGEPVVADRRNLIAIYPYRDSDETKVTEATKNVLFLICGVPGIPAVVLEEVAALTVENVKRFCGGSSD